MRVVSVTQTARVIEIATSGRVRHFLIRSGGLAEVARIRRHGRQHLATQACVLSGERLYARGRIWHPDHAPLALRGWHRVLLNREPFERVPGVRWVD